MDQRRPRAGTLPSLNTSDYLDPAHANNLSPPLSATGIHRPDALKRHLTTAYSQASSATTLHSLSTSVSSPSSARTSLNPSPVLLAADQFSSNAHGRIRSGSLTLQMPKKANVAEAFGSSMFSNAWTPSLEELKSVKSDESVHSGSIAGDSEHVKTLNYLGLDDPASPPPHASLQQQPHTHLKRQPSLDASLLLSATPPPALSTRLRANTVATPPNVRISQDTSSLSAISRRQSSNHLLNLLDSLPENAPHLNEDFSALSIDGTADTASRLAVDNQPEEFYFSSVTASLAANSKSVDNLSAIYGSSVNNPSTAAAFTAASIMNRPRASTTAALGADIHLSPNSSMRRRAGTTSQVSKGFGLYGTPDPDGNSLEDVFNNSGSLSLDDNASASSNSGQSNLYTSPTRSLWVGNLQEPELSSSDLYNVFSTYGAIDSIRILPEKMCAFVNFTNVHSAIAAKDDLLGRLGGKLGLSTVRIGYGKPESVPSTPAQIASAAFEASLQNSPTRALWIGNLPSFATVPDLSALFAQFGPIESVRVLSNKNCGFINMERLDDAIRARKALYGRELFGMDVGPVKIGFAKVPVNSGQEDFSAAGLLPPQLKPAPIPIEQQFYGAQSPLYMGMPASEDRLLPSAMQTAQNLQSALHLAGMNDSALAKGTEEAIQPNPAEMRAMLEELAGPIDSDDDASTQQALEKRIYISIVPPVLTPDNGGSRKRSLEAPALKEMRKRIDSGMLSAEDIDEIAAEYVEDAAQVAADYIGNTIIQKLYEKCSPPLRLALLDRIAPHLASIGCHKNGTWAAQKIIDSASSLEEVAIIIKSLEAYVPPLLLDQFGNYVVQCALRFGSPATDGIFDAMINRCWAIGQGRFGARSMRTVLESPFTPRHQQKRVAIAIICNAIALATNPNGSLLLNWLTDTSNFKGRYKLLAPKFVPHLGHLCVHKIASTIVLRLINQRADASCSHLLIQGIFHTSSVLESILGDQLHGISFIQKVLSSPLVMSDANVKTRLVEQVKNGLARMQVEQVPAFARMIHDLSGPSPMPTNLERSPKGKNNWIPPATSNSPQSRSYSPNHRAPFDPWTQNNRFSPQTRNDMLVPPQNYGSPANYQSGSPIPYNAPHYANSSPYSGQGPFNNPHGSPAQFHSGPSQQYQNAAGFYANQGQGPQNQYMQTYYQ